MKQAMWVQLIDKRGVKRCINFDRVEYFEDNTNGTTTIVFSAGDPDFAGTVSLDLSYDAVAEQIAQTQLSFAVLLGKGGLYGLEKAQPKS
jgi:competence transcription factor ComK